MTHKKNRTNDGCLAAVDTDVVALRCGCLGCAGVAHNWLQGHFEGAFSWLNGKVSPA